MTDGNQDLRDAVERKFEKVAEAVLDITEEILKEEQGAAPTRRKRKISGIERKGIIDPELASQLRETIEFRDVLTHTYGTIVNDDIVYDALQNSLERYVTFLEAVDGYLSEPSDA